MESGPVRVGGRVLGVGERIGFEGPGVPNMQAHPGQWGDRAAVNNRTRGMCSDAKNTDRNYCKQP